MKPAHCVSSGPDGARRREPHRQPGADGVHLIERAFGMRLPSGSCQLTGSKGCGREKVGIRSGRVFRRKGSPTRNYSSYPAAAIIFISGLVGCVLLVLILRIWLARS